MNEGKGSVSLWIDNLQAGDGIDEAAQHLWERYFDKLVHLARRRLRDARPGPADEEDVALSAFDSFCAAAAARRFPQLGGREDLWRLLVTITARKANAQIQRERRQKRGGGRVIGEAILRGTESSSSAGGIDQVADPEPTPEFAALVADELSRLLGLLRDETLRQVALLRMEGYRSDQIANQLGCGLRTVERKLELIRKAWLHEGER